MTKVGVILIIDLAHESRATIHGSLGATRAPIIRSLDAAWARLMKLIIPIWSTFTDAGLASTVCLRSLSLSALRRSTHG